MTILNKITTLTTIALVGTAFAASLAIASPSWNTHRGASSIDDLDKLGWSINDRRGGPEVDELNRLGRSILDRRGGPEVDELNRLG